MLGRSKSLRLLRGTRKELRQQDAELLTPPPASSEVEVDRLKVVTPVTAVDDRAHTPDVSQRPRTSGGPERGKLFHKKVPRAPVETDDAKADFPFASPNSTTATIYLAAEITESREGIIGIALGSPTMNSQWNHTPHTADFVSNQPGTITEISSQAPSKADAHKPKVSRWKSIFGRKPQPSDSKQSFYQVARDVVPARADSPHDDEVVHAVPMPAANEPKASPQSGSPPIFKPEIRESRNAPKGHEQPKLTRPRALTATKSTPSLFRSALSPKPPSKNAAERSPALPKVVISDGNPSVTTPALNGQKPVLDVDIPSIQMERYSVMFGSLLQTNSNRSSLLVRRQGNTERVKPLNELSAKNDRQASRGMPQRRATSPSQTKSPSVSLSLFPHTPGPRTPSPRAVSINRARPLQRSKTAPAVSPSRQSFNLEVPAEVSSSAIKDMKRQAPILEKDDSAAATPALAGTPTSRNSFDSEPEEIGIVVARASGLPWKAQVAEPNWEIVPKPTQRSALNSHPPNSELEQKATSSVPATSSSTPARTDSVANTRSIDKASPLSLDQDATHKSSTSDPKVQSPGTVRGTTVGIARSVSVSRASPRSADMLKPTLSRTMTERSVSPGLGRFGGHQPLTPTLVELKNRKSQRVQLVDA